MRSRERITPRLLALPGAEGDRRKPGAESTPMWLHCLRDPLFLPGPRAASDEPDKRACPRMSTGMHMANRARDGFAQAEHGSERVRSSGRFADVIAQETVWVYRAGNQA
ncbi:hypothetical protein JW848_02835 [Candidatus Bipolaricaulota bacterium]|nr:hypothetical protein [Candidatus Bipolaricaulota bacterium]